jgi:hypothetical protein
LFQGRHVVTAENPEPHDLEVPFQSNAEAAAGFLQGIPSLQEDQMEKLEEPLDIKELEEALAGAEANKSPGLDGLFYEFYKKTLRITGPRLLKTLNKMLEQGQLTKSLRRGVVRLLPKVAGVPTASQLRPITLLSVDYKILTKMLVARLVGFLPTVLTASRLCSVKGRSVFDGAAAVLSAANFLAAKVKPGFLVSLDLFHTHDWVSLPCVDKVLEAMGFGPKLRKTVWALHRGAMPTFMLHGLSPDMAILFSFRQEIPLP